MKPKLEHDQLPYEVIANLSFGALPDSPGFEAKTEIGQAWLVAKSFGLSVEQFRWLTPADIAALRRSAGWQDDPAREFPSAVKEMLRVRGGRPARPATDGEKLKMLRGEAKWTQEQLAEESENHVSTVQRGEADDPLSRDNVDSLAAALSKRLGRTISGEELEKS